MKAIAALLIAFAILAPGRALSQTPASPYVKSQDQLTALCNVVAIGAGAKEGTERVNSETLQSTLTMAKVPAETSSTDDPALQRIIAAGTAEIDSCLSDAKKKGVGYFEKYSSGETEAIKHDMKAVLVAWFTYVRASATHERSAVLGERDGNSYDIAKAAYDKAVSTLQVDRLAN